MGKRYPKNINIIAKLDPAKPDGVDFHMERPNGDKLETVVFDKKDDPGMGKGDEHEVSFTLIQETGMTLEFAHSLTDVLWVEWGTATKEPPCPETEPENCPDPIFYAERSTPRRMTAVNTNPSQQFFSFTINFTDRTATGPKKLIPFDPIGENKNGGIGLDPSGFTASTSTLTILAGVAVVLAIGYILLS